MRHFPRLAPLCLMLACNQPVSPPGRPLPASAPPEDAAALVPTAEAQHPDAAAAVLPELPPDERCDSALSVGAPRAWPEVPGREVASRRGGVDVRGKLVSLTAGYNCGGAPIGCPNLAPLAAVVMADDGTRIELRASHNERGEELSLGKRHLFSVVWCASSDGGAAFATLRGASIQGRTQGAAVGCLMGSEPPRPAAKLEVWPKLPLAALDRKSVLPGGFDTEGWVTDRFVPKPCPPGMACKPQLPPHVTLSDRATSPTNALVLLTPTPMAIAKGGPYQASVALCGSSTYGGGNEGTLVALRRK